MGVHAPWSQGKTLTLVFFAKRRNEVEGIPVIANFRMLGIDNFTFLNDIEAIKDINFTLVLLDEIRRYLDSYLSRGQKARLISNLVADLGKQSCDFYYSDQHYNAAPPRVKVNLSAIVEPSYDEETQWVTVYVYDSIENFLFKNPLFFFGFYGPDYWGYYDTKFKVEDYKMRFNVEKYSEEFLEWVNEQPWVEGVKLSAKLVNMWNLSSGSEFTRAEQGAVLTYIQIIQSKKQKEEEEE